MSHEPKAPERALSMDADEALATNARKMLSDAEKLAQIGSFEWDISNNKVTWSEGLYRIYGLSPEKFGASFEAFIAQVHPEDRDTVRATIHNAFETAQPFSLEERIVRRDGSLRYLRSKGEVITGEDGRPVRMLGVCQDITERKQAEQLVADYNRMLEERVEERTQQLQLANEKAEEALRQLKAIQHQMVMQAKTATVGNLVAGIAHELNTPVGAIKAAGDVAERCIARIVDMAEEPNPSLDGLSAALHSMLGTLRENQRVAKSASHRLAEIVDGLKVFSRVDQPSWASLELHEALNGILTLIQHQTDKGVRITKAYGDLPAIWCDPGQVNHVLMSLLLNACQAIEAPGEIRIATWSDASSVFVRIEDTGKGISTDKLERLFDLGFDAKDSRVHLGTGLFNAYHVVQRHGGEIDVASELGRGSTFTVRLPIRSSTSRALPAAG